MVAKGNGRGFGKGLKGFAIATALAMLVGSLAACGQNAGGGSAAAGSAGQEKTAVATKDAAKQEPIELVFYGGQSNWEDEMFWSLYGNLIKQKFPYITPKFIPNREKKLSDLVTAGEPIDLMLVTASGAQAAIIDYNFQTDLTPYIKESKFDVGKLNQTMVNVQRDMAGGGIYGLPEFVQIPIMVYNRDVFDKFGVPYPKEGMTWDQTYDMAVKLSREDGGKKYYGLGTTLTFHLKNSQIPVALIDPKTNKAQYDDNAKRVMENFARFFRISGYEFTESMAKGGITLENMFFKDQNLAMWPHYTNVARRIPEDVNWDAAPMPYYSGAIGVAPAADTYFLFVTSTSKHKQQAFDVAAFLTQTEAQINLSKEGFTPISRDKAVQDVFGQNYKTYAGKNVSAFFPANLAPAAPYSRYYSTADSTLFTEFVNYVVGKKDLNTALRDYQDAANKKIQEQIATGK